MPSQKLKKLETDLSNQEQYIKYLYGILEGYESEIEELRKTNSELRLQLKNALETISFKESIIEYQDEHIQEIENKNLELKNRISELSSKIMDTLPPSSGLPLEGLTDIALMNDVRGHVLLLQNRILSLSQNNELNNNTNEITRRIMEGVQLIIYRANENFKEKIKKCKEEKDDQIEIYQTLLNDENEKVEQLRQELNNARAQILRTDRMLTDALNNETNARRYWYDIAQRKRLKKQHWKTLYINCLADNGLLEYNRDRLEERYQKWKNKTHAERQNINNLNLQIANLNQPRMAAVHEIYQMLAPQLGLIPNYVGQYTPDDYHQKIINVFESAGAVITAANVANANTFVDVQKCDILKSKMGEKFTPVPVNDPYTAGNPAINSPATFIVWLREKYREVMSGNNELALQSLVQEKFNPIDTPDTYESRIRKCIVGFNDNTVLPILYTHLPSHLRSNVKMYMSIRGVGHQTVDNFFADLRKCWIEQKGDINFQQTQQYSQFQSMPTQPVIQPIKSYSQPWPRLYTADQIDKVAQDAINAYIQKYAKSDENAQILLECLAYRLGYSDGKPTDLDSLETFIDNELQRRLPADDIYNVLNIRREFGEMPTRKTTRRNTNYNKNKRTVAAPKKKKRSKRKTNYVEEDYSSEESISEYSSSSESSDDEIRICYGLKKETKKKKIIPNLSMISTK